VVIGDLAGVHGVAALLADAGPQAVTVARVFALLVTLAIAACAWRQPVLAWPAALGCLTLCWGCGIAPAINAQRSGAEFTRTALAAVPVDRELGLVAYKEQFLLYLDRDTFNFGHSRWREGQQEAYDAAAWLVAAEHRELLVPEILLQPCFVPSQRRLAGDRGSERWWLVTGRADAGCVAKGDRGRAIRYAARPPR
jgi:hypothetical protein